MHILNENKIRTEQHLKKKKKSFAAIIMAVECTMWNIYQCNEDGLIVLFCNRPAEFSAFCLFVFLGCVESFRQWKLVGMVTSHRSPRRLLPRTYKLKCCRTRIPSWGLRWQGTKRTWKSKLHVLPAAKWHVSLTQNGAYTVFLEY